MTKEKNILPIDALQRRQVLAVASFGWMAAMQECGISIEMAAERFHSRFNLPQAHTTDAIISSYYLSLRDVKGGGFSREKPGAGKDEAVRGEGV